MWKALSGCEAGPGHWGHWRCLRSGDGGVPLGQPRSSVEVTMPFLVMALASEQPEGRRFVGFRPRTDIILKPMSLLCPRYRSAAYVRPPPPQGTIKSSSWGPFLFFHVVLFIRVLDDIHTSATYARLHGPRPGFPRLRIRSDVQVTRWRTIGGHTRCPRAIPPRGFCPQTPAPHKE